MNAYSIGLSAIAAGQRGLDVTGQNIANANTPGYHRQGLSLTPRYFGEQGVGVEVARVRRFQAEFLEAAVNLSNSKSAGLTARLDTQRQVETFLAPGQGAIPERLGDFFNQIERLTARPDDRTLRREVLAAAEGLAIELNSASASLTALRGDISDRISVDVARVNQLTTQIAEMNLDIQRVELGGGSANEARDSRDLLVREMATLLDVRVVEQGQGQITIHAGAGGLPILVGSFTVPLETAFDTDGRLVVRDAVSGFELRPTTGGLSARLDEFNQGLPDYLDRLDRFAGELVRQLDPIQSTGVGSAGPVTFSVGARGVADPTAPLDSAGLAFPPQAGDLSIGVTDVATGVRSVVVVSVDPSSQSLNDLAASITASTGGQVQGTVGANGELRLQAQAGYAFDFAGPNADGAGVLTALGVGTFFAGNGAADIRLNPELKTDPTRLAGSLDGLPGDTANLERLAAVRDRGVFPAGQTFAGFFTELTGTVGATMRSLSSDLAAQRAIGENLRLQEQSIAGVDLNEEVVNLMRYQRMVEVATSYIRVVNDTLDAIVNIIR